MMHGTTNINLLRKFHCNFLTNPEHIQQQIPTISLPHLIKKYPALYGTRSFITFCTSEKRTKKSHETLNNIIINYCRLRPNVLQSN